MKESELLAKAKQVIEDPKHWTQGAYAREHRESFSKVLPTGPHATCWCSLGALHKAADVPISYVYEKGNQEGELVWEATLTLAEAIKNTTTGYTETPASVAAFNDQNDHGAVMKVFDEAIKLAKEKENAGSERKE